MVPLFPLPNVVLFPRVFLPLHIFEPRYREMVRDALAADRIIGMVLLRSGGAAGGADNPAVFPTGCAGRITHCEQLPDGRYNIVLRGVHKFRILEEDRTRSYRRASVETLDEPDCRQAHLRLSSATLYVFTSEGRSIPQSTCRTCKAYISVRKALF